MFATANAGPRPWWCAAAPASAATTPASAGSSAATVADTVRTVPGVAAAEAVVSGPAQIIAPDGRAIGGQRAAHPRVQLDRRSRHRARTRSPRAGRRARRRAPGRWRSSSTVARPTRPGSPWATPPRRSSLTRSRSTVVGIATFGDSDSMAGSTFTAFAPADASRLLGGGRPGVSEIRVAAEPGVGQEELAARISAVLPVGTEAITGTAAERRAAEVRRGQTS